MTAGHSHPGSGWRDPHRAPGSASLLDIGGDVGAVAVRLAGDTPSGELTACRRGAPSDHFHTGVHRRATADGEAWIAVFPEVTAGEYSLLGDEGVEHTPFVVVGGEVTTLTLDGIRS